MGSIAWEMQFALQVQLQISSHNLVQMAIMTEWSKWLLGPYWQYARRSFSYTLLYYGCKQIKNARLTDGKASFVQVQPSKDCVQKTLKRLEEKIQGRVLKQVLYALNSTEPLMQQRTATALARLLKGEQVRLQDFLCPDYVYLPACVCPTD